MSGTYAATWGQKLVADIPYLAKQLRGMLQRCLYKCFRVVQVMYHYKLFTLKTNRTLPSPSLSLTLLSNMNLGYLMYCRSNDGI
jgi:hypothetical protein